MQNGKLYGGIEAGGTKFVCGTGSGIGELRARAVIKTGDPAETIRHIVEFFAAQPPLAGIGIGCFGPVDVKPESPAYGTILNTPKPGWAGVNLVKEIGSKLNLPVKLQTDTDVAALGERYHGKAVRSHNFIYLTVGTGIGGSI